MAAPPRTRRCRAGRGASKYAESRPYQRLSRFERYSPLVVSRSSQQTWCAPEFYRGCGGRGARLLSERTKHDRKQWRRHRAAIVLATRNASHGGSEYFAVSTEL